MAKKSVKTVTKKELDKLDDSLSPDAPFHWCESCGNWFSNTRFGGLCVIVNSGMPDGVTDCTHFEKK